MSDLKRMLAEGIHSSGFPFEHQVYETLRRRGWSVLSNRYYLDTEERRPREVDMIAYKSAEFPDYDVRTAIIISCKKVESKKWVFMTRRDGIDHPNLNWNALYWVSTYPPFSRVRAYREWNKRFREYTSNKLLERPSELVFAFQEMELIKEQRARCCGNSSIQSSIMSTIKAQFHELQTQPTQLLGVKPRIYLFNLLTVTNAEMFKMKMDEESPVIEETGHISYLSDYIIEQKSTASRVEIVNFAELDGLLDQYEQLHRSSKKFYAYENGWFYQHVLRDEQLHSLLHEEFRKELRIAVFIASSYREAKDSLSAIAKCTPRWNGAEKLVELAVDLPQEKIDVLNDSEPIRNATARILKKIYRYEDKFAYGLEIPF